MTDLKLTRGQLFYWYIITFSNKTPLTRFVINKRWNGVDKTNYKLAALLVEPTERLIRKIVAALLILPIGITWATTVDHYLYYLTDKLTINDSDDANHLLYNLIIKDTAIGLPIYRKLKNKAIKIIAQTNNSNEAVLLEQAERNLIEQFSMISNG